MAEVDPQAKALKKKAEGRQQFVHKGQLVYEWDQTIDEVNIYLQPPPFLLKKYRAEYEKQLKSGEQLPKLVINIGKKELSVGMSGNPPYLKEEYSKEINATESLWVVEEDEVHIILQKAFKADTWTCVFKGHAELDDLMKQEMQKKLLLERFQEENPGFDFSQAVMNGNAPDPRKFLGGVSYK